MGDTATITALFNLIVVRIRDKGNGAPTTPADVRAVLDPIVAALGVSEDVKQPIYDAIATMLPDNMIKAIDPYELRGVLNMIVAAIGNAGGGESFATRKIICYRFADEDGNFNDRQIPPGIQIQPVLTPTSINDLIADAGQSRGEADVYRGTWQAPDVTRDAILIEGPEDVFITFFNFVDASEIQDLLQQILASQP